MHEPGLPTAYEVGAALWATGLLDGPSVSLSDAQEAYRRSVSGAVYTEVELGRGQDLLLRAGLLHVDGDQLYVSASTAALVDLDQETAFRVVVTRLLERDPPVWLRAAAGGVQVRHELLPDGIVEQLDALIGADTGRRDAMLLTAVRRAEQLRLAHLRDGGIACVAQACRDELIEAGEPVLADAVQVVADVSAAMACDVLAPTPGGVLRRLLVKTTRRLDWRLPIVVSRDEFEVGLVEPHWALVVCGVDAGGTGEVLGWCRADALAGFVPNDGHPLARWIFTSLLAVRPLLQPGLPQD